MITIPGQLAIKTIHGRNGDFNVGRLTTTVGEFVVKNAELDQYREGKYEGDFAIVEIKPSMYTAGGRMVIELRALLGGMTLSNIDPLTKDEAHRLSPQEVDPVDEETAKAQSVPAPAPASAAEPAASPAAESAVAPELAVPDPLIDTTPFGVEPAKAPAAKQDADAALFGVLWPLGQVLKLDPTVDRRVLRQQCARLDALGYEFDPRSQQWHLKAA